MTASVIRWVLRTLALVAIALGGLSFVSSIVRFGRDNFTNGSKLRHPGLAFVAMLLGAALVGLGVAMWRWADRLARSRRIAAAASVASVLAIVSVVVAARAIYPRDTRAQLVALDAATGQIRWRVTLPETEIDGIRQQPGGPVQISATLHDGCRYVAAVVLDVDPARGIVVAKQNLGAVPPFDGEFVLDITRTHPQTNLGAAEINEHLRFDPAGRHILSDRGWHISARADHGEVAALVTPGIVYLGEPGTTRTDCST